MDCLPGVRARMVRELSFKELQRVLGEKEELLGKGASCTVYKGFLDGKPVAVKKLKPEFSEHLVKELDVLRSHSHENIVRLHAFCVADPALVYELLTGGDLQWKIKSAKTNPIPWTDKLRMAFDISLGLNYLHSKGIIHRDMKPQNVLLDARGRCRIGDFGFARKVEGSSHLVTGAGTRGYQAPEIFRGEGMTQRSDVYALGWTLLNLLACVPGKDQEDGKLWGEWGLDEFYWNQPKWERGLQTQGLFGGKPRPGPLLARVLECLARDSGAWDPTVDQPVVECALRCISFNPASRPRTECVSSVMEKAWKAHEKVHATVPSPKTPPGSNAAKGSSSRNPFLKKHSSDAAPGATRAPKSSKTERTASQLGRSPWRSPMYCDKAQSSSDFGTSWNAEEWDIPEVADDGTGLPPAKRLTLSDLERATKDFSTKLGRGIGVFGITDWFEGLADPTFPGETGYMGLVVHKLEGSLGACQETVLKAIRLRHPNLDLLVAYSAEKGGACLAYRDYSSWVTLEGALLSEKKEELLSWDQRVWVALQAAEGLAHLHSENVIHGDFGPFNIRLDGEYNAVVTGVKGGGLECTSELHIDEPDECWPDTRLPRALYPSPSHWVQGSTFSTDTYSFGIVLLELLSGRKDGQRGELVRWAMPSLRVEGKPKTQKIIDPRLEENYSRAGATQLAILAKRCISNDPASRPEMKEVVGSLKVLYT